MKFPFRRISVRQALIAVAVVGIGLGIARWVEERRRVSMYRQMEQVCAGTELFLRRTACEARATGNIPRALSCEKAADQNARHKAYFARAALNPWKPLPDPAP
jgi:hypothetical protein